MKNLKITYIISNINKSLAFEWVIDYVDREKHELTFILLNPGNSELESYAKKKGITVKRIIYKGKKSIPLALFKCLIILLKSRPKVVHTHLFDANLIGLLASKLALIPVRIHTRHHSTWHHDYFPKAVKYDRFINKLSTKIIAITNNVKKVLVDLEKVPPSKVELLHHGFDLSIFTKVKESAINELKIKYRISRDDYPIIGVIARQTEWKGIQYIIPAFKKLLEQQPNAKLILANAKGDYKAEINKLLSDIPSTHFLEIEFENDLPALYQLFDLYIHTPINNHCEAFGQTYIEALAAGIPSIFTLSGIANEFVEHERNAIVVPYKDSDAIYHSMLRLLDNKDLRDTVIRNGMKDVQQFDIKEHIIALEKLYSSL